MGNMAFPMERLCGMLIPLVNSQQYPYTNLINQITMWTQFAHLQYYAEYNQKVFNIFQKEPQILPLERVFSFSMTEEELHSPFQKCTITKSEIRKVKQYYVTALDLTMNNIGVSVYICKFGLIYIMCN